LGVRTMGDHILGKYASKTPKMGVNRQFQTKMLKHKNTISLKL